MPPPKAKLHKNSGRTRPGPPKLSQNNGNGGNTTEPQPSHSSNNSEVGLTLTPEQEQQFQAELYWCVQQLQKALSTDKLTNKQIQEHTKALNTLMSSSAPLIKKRQVMRLSFGDYRSKMLENERKARKISIKVGAGKPSDKSMFLRKAMTAKEDFKFNFPSPEKDSLEGLTDKGHEMETESTLIKMPKNTLITKSDNSFRFNFSNDDTQNANGN